MANETSSLQLSNRLYGQIKQSATTLLPAVSALYLGLAQLWDFPAPEKVAGTVAALNVFLGVLLSVSTRSYNNSDAKYDGSVKVIQSEDGTRGGLVMNEGPEALLQKDEVTLKVDKS